MSFINRDIKISYKSLAKETEDKISEIINPLLEETKVYKRSVGFFNSSAFNFISEGLIKLIKNNGEIQLITSPKLSEEDIKAINLGYKNKEEIIKNIFSIEFQESLDKLKDENLRLVAEMVANNTLNIKIAKLKNLGMYHDKFAILEDNSEERVVFVGSNNETGFGYAENYEKVRVFKSWIDLDRVLDEEAEFNDIWNGTNDFIDTYNFPDAVKESILQVIEQRTPAPKSNKYELYDYQKEAIKNWRENGYNGFFVMATGTGKTVTALYGVKELLEKEQLFVVIAVPYKHLVSQWYDDVVDILPNCFIHKVAGEILNWELPIKDSIIYNKFNDPKPIIVISTISSFYYSRFQPVLKMNHQKRLLIVDEAHNFLNKIIEKKYDINFEYRLGLSATPIFGTAIEKTKTLVDFFGGIVFELPIEKAIGKYLVNYEYVPIFVHITEEEENQFNYYTKLMASCYKNNKLVDQEKFTKAYRGRLRTLSMAQEKMDGISNYIDRIGTPDHFIIYCSDGKIDDEKNLVTVSKILNEKGYKPSQFTASENMQDRLKLINNFNKGFISTLVAIRCLDEGINIPSIKSALIISSNDNYREFVQRRGRILRLYKDKQQAKIIDLIVLPSLDTKQIAIIEFRRYYEYAKIALNKTELLSDLENYLSEYGLTYDDIKFDNDFINDGGDLDD